MRFLKPRPFGGWRDLTIVRWRHVALILAAALVVIVPCAYVGSQFYRYKRHRYVSDRMEIAITRLALSCPEDLTEDQWAYCIGWTWNLHANSSKIPDYMPTAELRRIVEEFEAKIDAGPSLATIDWLWDEYERSSSIDYKRFRPTAAENRVQFQAGDHGGNTLASFRKDYEVLSGTR